MPTKPVDTTYFKSPTETNDQYMTRVDQYNKDKANQTSEPAVVTSTSVDEEIAGAKARLGTFAQKGVRTGADGSAVYADGSMVPAPQDSTYNEESGKHEYDGKSYSVAEFYDEDNEDADLAALNKMFDPLRERLDAATLGTVNGIRSQYKSLRTAQMQANEAAQTTTMGALLNAGGRYAPANMANRMLAETTFGIQALQNLNDQEDSAIAKAQAAHDAEDYKLMVESLDRAETIREKKQAKAEELMTKVSEANKKLQEDRYRASRDEAIASLITQGITDPTQMIDLLNKYEDGTPTGGNFTAEEIEKTLGNLTVSGSAQDLPADLETFEYIRNNFGLPADIAALPQDEQYFAYLAKVKRAETAPKAPGSEGGYTPTELRKLRNAGIDADDTAAADKFLYGEEEVSVPTWEEYLAAAQETAQQSFGKDAQAKLREQYDAEFGQYEGGNKPKPFTDAELKKLEQANLLNATRKEQLDFLLGDDADDLSMPDFSS